eukprot:COSAG03_NODE_23642_length_278_cov_0.798883_1_plen_29_part_10
MPRYHVCLMKFTHTLPLSLPLSRFLSLAP